MADKSFDWKQLVGIMTPLLASVGYGADGNNQVLRSRLEQIGTDMHKLSGGMTGEDAGKRMLKSLLGDSLFSKVEKSPEFSSTLAKVVDAGASIFDTSNNAVSIGKKMVVDNLMPI